MLKIGNYNELEIVKEVDFGLYLDGGPYGEILLPISYTNPDMKIGDDVRVFIYNDSEDRIIATTQTPALVVGEYAHLEVKETTRIGAFLDWGLDGKDLLVPFSEQRHNMEVGESHLVFMYLDKLTNRIVASSKLSRFLSSQNDGFEENQEVEITIAYATTLGYKVIINDTHLGMLYRNEVFKRIFIGGKEKAYIKKVREDNLIDVSLERQGYLGQIPDACKVVLEKLQNAKDGFLPLHDKSDPERIKSQLKMSKKAFKKAVGYLYKQKLVTLTDEGIKLK